MKKFIHIVFVLPLLTFGQVDEIPCEMLTKINKLIQENHYKPKAVDDSLSVYVFDTFLNSLDEDHRLFLAPEVDELQKNKLLVDDYILSKDCQFLKEFYTAYQKSITRYGLLIATLKKEPFPLSSNESIQFSKKAFPYAKDEKELKHLYKKRLLFTILHDVAELSKNKDSLKVNFETIAKKQKNKIFDKYECKILSYQLSETEFYALFYNAFCSYFDPHTNYFSQSEKSSFLSAVSADNLTFGLYISMSENDEMTVDEIIPGSSAYFSNKIDVGDQVIKINHNNDEFEIACSSLKKIEEIITSNNFKVADFTFRKKTGEIYKVNLVKKVMKDYQNNVYSYILKKGDINIGYIKIPSFYSTFETGESSVADDVVKEIFKLQKDKIDGLIIDLENNGGGSMDEAMRMSGLFIDVGPLAIMDDSKNKTETLKDTNRGTIFNGPMVVLINGFSASASEFFTNVMQDYYRAIIIGNTSLGKASMQRIFPLDEKNEEYLKLTLEKFYRLTGKSNQTIGITPDVEIPFLFDKQLPRESSFPTALKNDEIKVSVRYKYMVNDAYTQAILKSKNRIKESKEAKEITDLNTTINALFDNDLPPMALQFDPVYNDVIKINSIWATIKVTSETEYDINVQKNSADIEYQQFDEYLKSANVEKTKNIRQNFHILEATNIIYDLIFLKP